MAEILPDGTMQGYYNICEYCGKTIEVNMQGNPINHKCEVKNLDIQPVIKSVCFRCNGSGKTVASDGSERDCPQCHGQTVL